MIIQEAQYTTSFQRVPDVRKRIFALEDRLGGIMSKPFQGMGVPDDAPAEIPRITAVTQRGQSQLVINQVSCAVQTSFDVDQSRNWPKCYDYLAGILPTVGSAVTHVLRAEQTFVGLALKIYFPYQLGTVIPHLVRTTLRENAGLAPVEMELRRAFIQDDTHYINVTVGLSALYEGTAPSPQVPARGLKLAGEAIEVILDVNDRYAFNFVEGYRSTPDAITSILRIADDVIRNRLVRFVQEGEWR